MDQQQEGSVRIERRSQMHGVDSETDERGSSSNSGLIFSLRRLWQERRKVYRFLVAGTVFSLIVAFCLGDEYTSTATLMPPEGQPSTSNLMGLALASSPAAGLGSSLLGAKTQDALFVGILGSRTVQENLVMRFDLVHYFGENLVEDACKKLAAETQVKDDTKTGIITISVTDKDAVLASKLAQGYVQELDRVVNHNSTSAARRERIFLEARLNEIKKDLNDSSIALSQFSTNSRTIDMPTQAKAMVEAAIKLQAELVTARAEVAGLRESYSADNVRVRAANARVKEIERQLQQINGPSKGATSVTGVQDRAYPSIDELPGLALTYADLDRKVLVEEGLWESLTKQLETAKVEEARDIPSVRVLDEASMPQRKSFPSRSSIVALGALLSFFTGCILVMAASLWEGIDVLDERKKLAAEIAGNLLDQHRWLLRLAGIARLKSPFFMSRAR